MCEALRSSVAPGDYPDLHAYSKFWQSPSPAGPCPFLTSAAPAPVRIRRGPGLLLASASAGVADAFNTSLAGIVFGIEEISRSFEARTSGIILGAVIAAGIT